MEYLAILNYSLQHNHLCAFYTKMAKMVNMVNMVKLKWNIIFVIQTIPTR